MDTHPRWGRWEMETAIRSKMMTIAQARLAEARDPWQGRRWAPGATDEYGVPIDAEPEPPRPHDFEDVIQALEVRPCPQD